MKVQIKTKEQMVNSGIVPDKDIAKFLSGGTFCCKISFIDSMHEYLGKVCNAINSEDGWYRMDECPWAWSKDMLIFLGDDNENND